MSVLVSECVCVFLCVCVRAFVHMCAWICVCVCVCVCVHAHAHACVCVCLYMPLYVIHVCVCLFQVIISVSELIGKVVGLSTTRFQESLAIVNNYANSDKSIQVSAPICFACVCVVVIHVCGMWAYECLLCLFVSVPFCVFGECICVCTCVQVCVVMSHHMYIC